MWFLIQNCTFMAIFEFVHTSFDYQKVFILLNSNSWDAVEI